MGDYVGGHIYGKFFNEILFIFFEIAYIYEIKYEMNFFFKKSNFKITFIY